MGSPDWRTAVLAAVLLSACGGAGEKEGGAPDPDYERYLADKRHCEAVSSLEAAQKSCMTYRGWPDGRYRRR